MSAQQNTINALKGKRKGYKGKGKGYKGKGQGFKGGNWKGGCKFPGKAIGQGLDYYSNEEYVEVWGEDDYNYNYDGEN